ncbi:hypothetical protein QOT17_018515 [Balamuthia mandrillaris]
MRTSNTSRSSFVLLLVLLCTIVERNVLTAAAAEAEDSCISLDTVGYAVPQSCETLLGTNASVHSPWTEEAVSEYMQPFAVAPLNCQKAAAEFICQLAYPSCYTYDSPSHQEDQQFQQKVCRSVCQDLFVECEAFFEVTGTTPPNICPLLPEGNTTHTLANGTTVEVPCSSLQYTEEQEKSLYPVYPCPPELVEHGKGKCTLPCPNPLYTKEEWDGWDGISTAFWLISFVACLFFLLTQIGRAIATRKSPLSTLTFWMVFQIFLACLNALWAISYGWDELRCLEDRTPRKGGACAAWGFFFTYFCLSINIWWLIIVINMLITVSLQRPVLPTQVTVFYHICGWILPLISPSILSGLGLIGYDGGPWCQPTPDDPDDLSSSYWWTFSLFYLPVTIIVTVGLCCNFMVVIFIWKWGRLEGLKAQWRTVALVFGMFCAYSFVLVIFYQRMSYRDQVEDAALEYVKCVLTTTAPEERENCEGDSPYNYPFICLTLISVASYGAIAVLLFGTRFGDMMFWKRGFINLLRRRSFFDQKNPPRKLGSRSATRSTHTTTSQSSSNNNNNNNNTDDDEDEDDDDYKSESSEEKEEED